MTTDTALTQLKADLAAARRYVWEKLPPQSADDPFNPLFAERHRLEAAYRAGMMDERAKWERKEREHVTASRVTENPSPYTHEVTADIEALNGPSKCIHCGRQKFGNAICACMMFQTY